MPTPNVTLLTQSPDLQTFFEYEYEASEAYFIGSRVMPLLSVPRQAGNFGRITLETLMEHSTSTLRAPTSGYNRRQYEFEQDSWSTIEHGIEEILDDREVDMYSSYFAAEAVATRRAVNSILTAHEQRVATATMDTTFYNSDAKYFVDAATVWSDPASTPIEDIEAAWVKFRNNTGFRPNAIIINEYTYRALRNHPDIIARVTSDGAGDQARARDVNVAQLEAVLDIDQVLVGGGMYNMANPSQSAQLSDIWPNVALVTKTARTNDIREACIGRTMHWQGDGSSPGGLIETYREEAIRSGVVRVRHDTDEKILYPELGVMINAVLS